MRGDRRELRGVVGDRGGGAVVRVVREAPADTLGTPRTVALGIALSAR